MLGERAGTLGTKGEEKYNVFCVYRFGFDGRPLRRLDL